MKISRFHIGVLFILGVTSCHQPTEEELLIEKLNSLPTKFAHVETDIYYFQERTIVRYAHEDHSVNAVFTTDIIPYSVKTSRDRRELFFADNAWSGQLHVYDIGSQIEKKTAIIVQDYFPSNSGGKVIYYDGMYTDGLMVYDISKYRKYPLVDSLVTKYTHANVEYYIFERDTFAMTAYVLSKTANGLIYNRDSTYAFTYNKGTGYGNGYVTNLLTGEKRMLLEDMGKRTVYSMNFSPSGTQLVFSMYLSNAGRSYVFVSNADGSTPAVISQKNASSVRGVFAGNK